MRILPVPGDLPVERGHVTATLAGIEAITFDFGNTLVPVSRAALRQVVELIATAAAGMRARDYTPKPSPTTCGYCPFRAICPSSVAT